MEFQANNIIDAEISHSVSDVTRGLVFIFFFSFYPLVNFEFVVRRPHAIGQLPIQILGAVDTSFNPSKKKENTSTNLIINAEIQMSRRHWILNVFIVFFSRKSH